VYATSTTASATTAVSMTWAAAIRSFRFRAWSGVAGVEAKSAAGPQGAVSGGCLDLGKDPVGNLVHDLL
jgi:hypothetical protein